MTTAISPERLKPRSLPAVLSAYPATALAAGHHLLQEKRRMIPPEDRRTAPCPAADGFQHRTRLATFQGAAS